MYGPIFNSQYNSYISSIVYKDIVAYENINDDYLKIVSN